MNGFAVSGVAQARGTRRLGIVCGRNRRRTETRGEQRDDFMLSVGFGGTQPEEIAISEQNRFRPNRFAIGSLITYRAEDRSAFPPFMD